MRAADARLAAAFDEVGHLTAGKSVGREGALFLSDDRALVQFEHGGDVSPDVTIWTTTRAPDRPRAALEDVLTPEHRSPIIGQLGKLSVRLEALLNELQPERRERVEEDE